MRRVAPAIVLLALAGCGQDRAGEPSGGPATPSAASNSATPPAASPLGAGSAMSGSVSGLVGKITAFRVQETATQIIVDLAADVLFAFDSADLSAQAPAELTKTVAQIQRGGTGPITVVGHTDSVGDDAYNDALSLRRAQAVAEWLSGEGGVDQARLRPEGRGEREPVAANQLNGADNPDGRAQNRRVRIVIPKA